MTTVLVLLWWAPLRKALDPFLIFFLNDQLFYFAPNFTFCLLLCEPVWPNCIFSKNCQRLCPMCFSPNTKAPCKRVSRLMSAQVVVFSNQRAFKLKMKITYRIFKILTSTNKDKFAQTDEISFHLVALSLSSSFFLSLHFLFEIFLGLEIFNPRASSETVSNRVSLDHLSDRF